MEQWWGGVDHDAGATGRVQPRRFVGVIIFQTLTDNTFYMLWGVCCRPTLVAVQEGRSAFCAAASPPAPTPSTWDAWWTCGPTGPAAASTTRSSSPRSGVCVCACVVVWVRAA